MEPRQDLFSAFVEREEEAEELEGSGSCRYAVKDMFDVAGRAPSCGIGKSSLPIPVATAPVLNRLDKAGYVRVGFTAMSALAFEPSGFNPNQTMPINPWGVDYVTGGSSSGSAVAVASGLVPLALGTDTAGSVRIPAACCGIVGWKPAWRSVPLEGAMPLAPSLDTVGLLAADVVSILRAAPIIADSFPAQMPETARDGFVVIADALDAAHPEVKKAVNDVIEILADDLGPVLRMDGLAAIEAAGNSTLSILSREACFALEDRIAHGIADESLVRRLEKGRETSRAEVDEALSRREAEALRFHSEVMKGAALTVLPTMPLPTPMRADVDPSSGSFRPRILYAMSAYTRFVNYLGWPAVSVPAGTDSRGMPVGAQLVGPPGSDRLLLHAAGLVEKSELLNRKDVR